MVGLASVWGGLDGEVAQPSKSRAGRPSRPTVTSPGESAKTPTSSDPLRRGRTRVVSCSSWSRMPLMLRRARRQVAMRCRPHCRPPLRREHRRAVHGGRRYRPHGHARLGQARRQDRPIRSGFQVATRRDGQPPRTQPVRLVRVRRQHEPRRERHRHRASHYPVMRWARAVDPTDVSRDDAILTGLMKWATTVVVAPLKGNREALAKSLTEFPAEFLLFSPHMEEVGLEDRQSGAARSITISRDESGAVALNHANRRSLWVVRSQRHHPSKRALDDGGYSAARESVEISWAAPLEGAPKGIGRFWAYFPTASLTTLSGIVNAPWKLADDRESLLAGEFNEELLSEVLPETGGGRACLHPPTGQANRRPGRHAGARQGVAQLGGQPPERTGDEGHQRAAVHSHARRRLATPNAGQAPPGSTHAGGARTVGVGLPGPRRLGKPCGAQQ